MGLTIYVNGVTRETFTSGTELIVNNDYKKNLDITNVQINIPAGLVVHYPKSNTDKWTNTRTDGTQQTIVFGPNATFDSRNKFSFILRFIGASTGDCEILMIPTVVNNWPV